MLNKRELASVLAGLRALQGTYSQAELDEIATGGGQFKRLLPGDLDDLSSCLSGSFVLGENVYVDDGNIKGEAEIIAVGLNFVAVRLDDGLRGCRDGIIATVRTGNVYPLDETSPLVASAKAVLSLLEAEGRDTGAGGPLSDLRDAIAAARAAK